MTIEKIELEVFEGGNGADQVNDRQVVLVIDDDRAAAIARIRGLVAAGILARGSLDAADAEWTVDGDVCQVVASQLEVRGSTGRLTGTDNRTGTSLVSDEFPLGEVGAVEPGSTLTSVVNALLRGFGVELLTYAHSHRHGDDSGLVLAPAESSFEEIKEAMVLSSPDTYELDREDEHLDLSRSTGENWLVDVRHSVEHWRSVQAISVGDRVRLDGGRVIVVDRILSGDGVHYMVDPDDEVSNPVSPLSTLHFAGDQAYCHNVVEVLPKEQVAA